MLQGGRTPPLVAVRAALRGADCLSTFYQNGASHVYPDAFERYSSAIPPSERGDFLQAYHRRLTSADWAERVRAARSWARW